MNRDHLTLVRWWLAASHTDPHATALSRTRYTLSRIASQAEKSMGNPGSRDTGVACMLVKVRTWMANR